MEYDPTGDWDEEPDEEYEFEDEEPWSDITHEGLGIAIIQSEGKYRDTKEKFNLYRGIWKDYEKITKCENVNDQNVKMTIDNMMQARDVCYSMHWLAANLTTLDYIHNIALGLNALSVEEFEGYGLSRITERYRRITKPLQMRIQRLDQAIGFLENLAKNN